jgi:hypothetical protein
MNVYVLRAETKDRTLINGKNKNEKTEIDCS